MNPTKLGSPASSPEARPALRWGLALVAIVALLILLGGSASRTAVAAIRGAAAGAEGPGAEALVYLAAAGFTFLTVFLPLPAEASAFLNGALFPPLPAFMLTWIMAMAGAGASYEIGRRYGQRPAAWMFGAQRLLRVERLLDRAGWPTLLALRLSPVMAFTAINWASGILALSRPVFYWTTAVGLMPGTYVFTIAPELLENGATMWTLILLALAVAGGLLGVSWLRLRRPA